jgi:hypothetical protein
MPEDGGIRSPGMGQQARESRLFRLRTARNLIILPIESGLNLEAFPPITWRLERLERPVYASWFP